MENLVFQKSMHTQPPPLCFHYCSIATKKEAWSATGESSITGVCVCVCVCVCVHVCNTLTRAHTPVVTQITTNVELWELSARYHLSDTDPVSQDKVSLVCASRLLLMYNHNYCYRV